jgi:prepilin-type N-terminal cleavage/methylation domain-containing protein
MSKKRNHALSRSGFSLLEVVIALTILGMITGTLFAIIRGSVKGSVDIVRLQQETDQINHLMDLCRQTFQALPASATLTLSTDDPNSPAGSLQELSITGMPTCFAVGLQPVSYKETTLGLRPDTKQPTGDNGALRYLLCLSRDDIVPPMDASGSTAYITRPELGMVQDEEERYWLPLLRGVSSLKWRFWKEDTDEWLEVWEQTALPDLVEMQLLMDGRVTPLRMVFSMPIKTLRAGSSNGNR